MLPKVEHLMGNGMPDFLAKEVGGAWVSVDAAGSAITDATDLGQRVSLVSGADAAKGVQLPSEMRVGDTYVVINLDNAVLLVYPPDASSQIDVGGAATAYSQTARTTAFYMMVAANDVRCGQCA
jgi:hypothetical protein